jgi:hypothetical protein
VSDTSLTDLLRVAGDDRVSQTHGPMPARVIAYASATQRADVQRVIGVRNELGIVEPAPIQQGVPVAWGEIQWPLLPGSWVMLVPQDADISAWGTSGTTGQAAPTPRSCSWSDCIAVPWCPSPVPVVLTDFVALASKVLTELGNLKSWLDLHKHGLTDPVSGPLMTTTPLTAILPAPVPDVVPAPGSVASTKVKCG